MTEDHKIHRDKMLHNDSNFTKFIDKINTSKYC